MFTTSGAEALETYRKHLNVAAKHVKVQDSEAIHAHADPNRHVSRQIVLMPVVFGPFKFVSKKCF